MLNNERHYLSIRQEERKYAANFLREISKDGLRAGLIINDGDEGAENLYRTVCTIINKMADCIENGDYEITPVNLEQRVPTRNDCDEFNYDTLENDKNGSQAQTNKSEQYLTIAECAQIARCASITIWRAIRSGDLQAGRVGGPRGNWRVPASALKIYLNTNGAITVSTDSDNRNEQT